MNDKELIGKVHSAVNHQCQRRGYAAPVDVLMEIGVLPKHTKIALPSSTQKATKSKAKHLRITH